MLTVFNTTLEQMLGILALIAVGFLLNKTKTVTPAGRSTLSKLCVDVFLPALIFKTMINQCSLSSLKSYGIYIVYGCLFMLLSAVISVLMTRKQESRPELRGVYRYAIAFTNTSSIATPIVLALFGEAGFFKYSLFWLGYRYLTFLWGVPQLLPADKVTTRRDRMKQLFSPALIATFAGSAVGFFELGGYIPSFVLYGIDKLGTCYTAASLIVAGVIIADYSILSVIKIRKAYLVSFVRLILIPCAFYALGRLLHFSDEICTMILLTFACPCGMNIVIFPAAYGNESELGASIVMLSTVFSVITIPLLYAVL